MRRGGELDGSADVGEGRRRAGRLRLSRQGRKLVECEDMGPARRPVEQKAGVTVGTRRVRAGDPRARRGLDMAQMVQHQVEGGDPAATDQKDGGEEQ